MVAIPDDISFDEASFIEPVNTCIKAVEKARVASGETVIVMGLGTIGLLAGDALQAGGRDGDWAAIPCRKSPREKHFSRP